jgi:hypothetical protein
MRSTANILASYLTGSPLPPNAVNDVGSLLASADDEAVFELIGIEPPPSASSTNVNVGYIPLRRGPLVVGSGSAREVTVLPMRAIRSSTSNASPRDCLSAVLSAPSTKTLPAAPSAGNWGIELLYAQIAYVDSSHPTKGTSVTLHWATSPTYVSTASAPNFATLPANTSTTWNVPIRYVKNVAGTTSIADDDIFEVPPAIGSTLGNLSHLIRARLGGINYQRGYHPANNDPVNLVSGGSSPYANGLFILDPTVTPTGIRRGENHLEIRDFMLTHRLLSRTNGADATVVLDSTLDWRYANFLVMWNLGRTTHVYCSEEDLSLFVTRNIPGSYDDTTGFQPIFITTGHSFLAASPATIEVCRVSQDSTKSVPINGGTYPYASGYLKLQVNHTTGNLELVKNIPGTAGTDGMAGWLVVMAFFPNFKG